MFQTGVGDVRLFQVEMPQYAPGSLSRPETADVVAYILSGNRIPAGETDLPHDLDALSDIRFAP